MQIYKITNDINGKVYIGQTIRDINERFKRHISDAINNINDTHLARAIRKYGYEHFHIEIIDTAISQDDLNKKEQYWIHYYDSIACGYNETDATYKSGGNTYKSKAPSELESIRAKLSESKRGTKNPNSCAIKCKNIVTCEELFFDTVNECRQYFHERHHRFITTRCMGDVLSLYKGQWAIAYLDKEYVYELDPHRRGHRVKAENLLTNTVEIYNSIRHLCSSLNLNRLIVNRQLKNHKQCVVNNYKIALID